jgi:hypothetical protein
VKVTGTREVLPKDARTDELSVPFNQLAVGFVREQELRLSRYRQRIENAEDYRGREREPNSN